MTVAQEKYVKYEKNKKIAYITLNRPDVLNAMNIQMHEELATIWDDFEADDNILLGILSGAGTRAFSVGQDLKELAKQSETSSIGSLNRPGWPRLTERFSRVKPIIAKVHGYALGGGFELALASDIIVATHDAKFGLPEAKLGLIPGAGGMFRLTRQIPSRIALGYLLTGRTISASRAFELGLINEVVSPEALDACAQSFADDILRCAPLSIRAIQEATSKSSNLTLEQAFSSNYNWETIRKNSLDAKEGAEAFAEKRPPIWQGK